jgi:hypothetical protein
VEYGYRYDDSGVIVHDLDPPVVDPITYRPGTWPGARLPHVFLNDGISLHDKLGLFFTLIALDNVDSAVIEAEARMLDMPLFILRLGRPDLKPVFERDLLLVRPDQHVAWRGDSLPADVAGLLLHVIGR